MESYSLLPSDTIIYYVQNNAKVVVKTYYDSTNESIFVCISLFNFFSSASFPIIHWGLSMNDRNEWQLPPSALSLPCNSNFVGNAIQTTCTKKEDGNNCFFFKIEMNKKCFENNEFPLCFSFVIYDKDTNNWIKNNNSNFSILIREQIYNILDCKQFSSIVEKRIIKSESFEIFRRAWAIKDDCKFIHLELIGYTDKNGVIIEMYNDGNSPLILHWGFCLNKNSTEWTLPLFEDCNRKISDLCKEKRDGKKDDNEPSDVFISQKWNDKSVQTYFEVLNSLDRKVLQWLRIYILNVVCPHGIYFVLKEQNSNKWIKNDFIEHENVNKGDFFFEILQHPTWKQIKKEYEELVIEKKKKEEEKQRMKEITWKSTYKNFKQERCERMQKKNICYHTFVLANEMGDVDCRVSLNESKTLIKVELIACIKVLVILHWGILKDDKKKSRLRRLNEWFCPPQCLRPPNTIVVDPMRACQTELNRDSESNEFIQKFTVEIECLPSTIKESEGDSGVECNIYGIAFIFRSKNDENMWIKQANNKDMQVILINNEERWPGKQSELVETIIDAEVRWDHMTLMHRYQLIYDMINKWWTTHSEKEENVERDFKKRAEEWSVIFKEEKVHTFSAIPTKSGSCILDTNENDHSNIEFWSWIYVWSRFSYLGLLDWQRNYNTKPRELAHTSELLTFKVTEMWIKNPEYRPLIRLSLSNMSRGGCSGQAIRDKILDIMHKHSIAENRENFYEQWHQKLHNNTTPDDVIICKALIEFLRSNGDVKQYWNVLNDHGLTKEKLERYDRPIISTPFLIGNTEKMIADFMEYLNILQDVHDALDLEKSYGHAYPYLSSEIRIALDWIVRDIKAKSLLDVANINDAHEKFCKISHVRNCLAFELNALKTEISAVRELLLLDCCLEQQQILVTQSSNNFNLLQLTIQLKDYLVSIFSHDPTNEELHAISADWIHLSEKCACSSIGDSTESVLLLKNLVDRVCRVVGDMMDKWSECFKSKSEYLGMQVGVDKKEIDIFVDEILRSTSLLSISFNLKRIEPLLRKAANLPSWQIISAVKHIQGQLIHVDKLFNIQDKTFNIPTILLSGLVNGEEEIPIGVCGILVKNAAASPDILSHISIRARNAKILLAVCFDNEIAINLESNLAGKCVDVNLSKDGCNLTINESLSTNVNQFNKEEIKNEFVVEPLNTEQTCKNVKTNKIDSLELEKNKNEEMQPQINLTISCDKWIVPCTLFDKKYVGSKSMNLAFLSRMLPLDVWTPQSVALPFGCFQRTLKDKQNVMHFEKLKSVLYKLKPDTSNSQAEIIFRSAREIILELKRPEGMFEEIHKCMKITDEENPNLRQKRKKNSKVEMTKALHDVSLTTLFEKGKDKNENLLILEKYWMSILTVWSSLFAMRPWISLTKAKRNFYDLNMCVLIQNLIPANYAFVLHTQNPFSEDKDEMYGELVPGLGETLVGNYPGRSLSWRMKRSHDEIKIVSFLSKSVALQSKECLIFRSDSNKEDLEGFAGAGLFESVYSETPNKVWLQYYNLKIISDREYRNQLLRKIGKLAFLIEDKFGCPQDIEGVVVGEDQLVIVQSRPQI